MTDQNNRNRPDRHTTSIPRRRFLQGTAAGLFATTMPIAGISWSADGKKILRARGRADLDKLDPGFYQNSYNVDVMNCIYPNVA